MTKKEINPDRELRKYIYYDTATIKIMDEFEGKNGEPFGKLIIENKFYHKCDEIYYSVQLVVERGKYSDYVGNITFTNLKKKKTRALDDFIASQITIDVVNEYKKKDKIFYFSKPYLLRAQNSSNRSGYGWNWDWSDGIGSYTEGTYYGETTDYFIVGGYIN